MAENSDWWKNEVREIKKDTEEFRKWLEPAMDEFRSVYLSKGNHPLFEKDQVAKKDETSKFTADDLSNFTELSPGAYLENRSVSEPPKQYWVDFYGSPEAADRAAKAKSKYSEELRRERPHGTEEWESGPDHAQNIQDLGDLIGKVPLPVTSAVGSGMYTAGAIAGGKVYEAIGGFAGFGFGKAAKSIAQNIIESKKYKDLVLKYGSDIADAIASQAVQEIAEYTQKLTGDKDMPGTSDAIAITTEDVQSNTVSPEDAFKMVQEAMAKGQEHYDKLPADIKKLAKEYSEGTLVSSDFTAY